MRIIVGNDYYDKAQAYGADNSITLVRERERFLDKNKAPPGIYHKDFDVGIGPLDLKSKGFFITRHNRNFTVTNKSNGNVDHWYLQPVVVAVGGKIYYGIETSCNLVSNCYWTFNAFCNWLSSLNMCVRNLSTFRYGSLAQLNEDYFKVDGVSQLTMEWLITNKVFVITYNSGASYQRVYDGRSWRINGDNLKDFQFVKVMDPYTIYQELSMWVGGVLPASANSMIEITDKDRIHKHGFDKFSFRKQKENAK